MRRGVPANAQSNAKKRETPRGLKPITIDIVKAISFVCGGLLISEIVNSFQTLIKILETNYGGNELFLKGVTFFCIYLGIVILILLIAFWIASMMFGVASKGKNIFIEVANNNLNAVLLFCGILLALTFAAKSGIAPLLDQFIPYPTMPIYN